MPGVLANRQPLVSGAQATSQGSRVGVDDRPAPSRWQIGSRREPSREGSRVTIEGTLVRGNPDEIAISYSATLRETLSRMLGQGFKSIPVVDDRNRLVGEVALSDIEAVTAETEA